MPIPGVDFVIGVVTEIIVDKIKDKTKEAILPNGNTPSQEELTHDVHTLLLDFMEEYKQSQAGAGDLFNVVTISKSTAGGAYKPFLKARQHVQIFCGLGCTLTAIGVTGTYPVTIPPYKRTTIDAPDGTIYYLDPGSATPTILVEERLTNQAVS